MQQWTRNADAARGEAFLKPRSYCWPQFQRAYWDKEPLITLGLLNFYTFNFHLIDFAGVTLSLFVLSVMFLVTL